MPAHNVTADPETVRAWPPGSLHLPQPYLLFLGDVTEHTSAKTAFGLRDWVPERCIGEFSISGCGVSTGLKNITPYEAYEAGAKSAVIGVAPVGGHLAPVWLQALLEALEAGLDLISGLHTRLVSVPELRTAAERLGRRLIDVRQPPAGLRVATGTKRSGRRILTVGTDCALGKKYTALSLVREMRARGLAVDFRATGQTGIIIAGEGIAMDAVAADFLAGAAEQLSPNASPMHWDVIEGQGSLLHPAYAGVSLGLLHGSQPDALVLCHDPRRRTMFGFPDFPVPSIEETLAANLTHARRVNHAARFAGISLNTGLLSATEARTVIATAAREFGLPVADPIRGGPAFDALVDSCLA